MFDARPIIGAIMATLVAHTAFAQSTPVRPKATPMQTPVKPTTKVEVRKPAVPRRPSVNQSATVANTGVKARANTAISKPAAVRPGIRVFDRVSPYSDHKFVRYIVPNIADTPATELIVERKSVCGWTSTAFDGSKTPKADNRENCAELFQIYSDAVARLANEPPADQNYYELKIPKRSSIWPRLLNSGLFNRPVMVVAKGPGARVTRHVLQPFEGIAREEQVSVRVDRDRDGVSPFSAGGLDCDDNDASRFPGNLEIPNDRDEDCDPNTIGTLDRDGDGFTDWNVSNPAFANRRTPLRGGDCDDTDRRTHPNAPEDLDDRIDNDCDGDIDFVER